MKTKHKMKKGIEEMLQKVEYLKKTERKADGNDVETWVIQQVELFRSITSGVECHPGINGMHRSSGENWL